MSKKIYETAKILQMHFIIFPEKYHLVLLECFCIFTSCIMTEIHINTFLGNSIIHIVHSKENGRGEIRYIR